MTVFVHTRRRVFRLTAVSLEGLSSALHHRSRTYYPRAAAWSPRLCSVTFECTHPRPCCWLEAVPARVQRRFSNGISLYSNRNSRCVTRAHPAGGEEHRQQERRHHGRGPEQVAPLVGAPPTQQQHPPESQQARFIVPFGSLPMSAPTVTIHAPPWLLQLLPLLAAMTSSSGFSDAVLLTICFVVLSGN